MSEILIPNGGETQKTNVRVVISLNSALGPDEGLQLFRNTFALGLATKQSDLSYFFIDNVFLGGNFNYTAKVQKLDGSLVDSNDYLIRLGGAMVIDLSIDDSNINGYAHAYALIPGKKYIQKTFKRSLFPASDDVSLQFPIVRNFTASGNLVEYLTLFPRGMPSYTSNDSVMYIEVWDENNVVLEGLSNPVIIFGTVPSTTPIVKEAIVLAYDSNYFNPNAKACVRTDVPAGGNINFSVVFARMHIGTNYTPVFTMRKKGTVNPIPVTITSSGQTNGAATTFTSNINYDIPANLTPGAYLIKMGLTDQNGLVVIETSEISVIVADPALFVLPNTTYAIDIYSGNATQNLVAGNVYNFYFALTGMGHNRQYSLKVNRLSLSAVPNTFVDFTKVITTDGVGAYSGTTPFAIASNVYQDSTSAWCEVTDVVDNKVVLNSDLVKQDISGAEAPARIIYPASKLTWSVTSGSISPGSVVNLFVSLTGVGVNKLFSFTGNILNADNSVLVSFIEKYITTDSSGNGSVTFGVTIPSNAVAGNISINIVGVYGSGPGNYLYQINGTPIQTSIGAPVPTAQWAIKNGQTSTVHRGDSFFGAGYVLNLLPNTNYTTIFKISVNGVNTDITSNTRTSDGAGELSLDFGIVVPVDAVYGSTNYFVEVRDTNNVVILTTTNIAFTVVVQGAPAVLNYALANGQASTINEGGDIHLVGTYTNLTPNDYCYIGFYKQLNGGYPYQLGFTSFNVDSNGLMNFNLDTTMATTGFFGGFQPGDTVGYYVTVYNNSYNVIAPTSNIVNTTVGVLALIPIVVYNNTGSSNISFGDTMVGNCVVTQVDPNKQYNIYIVCNDSQYYSFDLVNTSYTSDNNGEIHFSLNTPFPAGVHAGAFTLDVYLRDFTTNNTIGRSSTITYNVIVIIPNVLLVKITGQGIDGSTNIVDTSDVVKTITKDAGVSLSTLSYPVGSTSSIKFNGTSNYVKATIDPMDIEIPFSIEADIYFNAITNTGFGSFGSYGGSVRGISFILNTNGTYGAYFGKGGDVSSTILGSGTLTTGRWYHVAMQSIGSGSNKFKLFVDYNQVGIGNTPGMYLTNNAITAGRLFGDVGGNYTNGALANLVVRTGPNEVSRDFTTVPTPPVLTPGITAVLSASQVQPVLIGNTISFDVSISNLTANTSYNINYEHVYAPSGIYVVSTDTLSTNSSGNLIYTKSITLADGWNSSLPLADSQVINFNVLVATTGGTTVLTSSNIPITVSIPVAHPYPTYVVVAMRFEGADGSTTFVDETNTGNVVTFTGDAHISTTDPIFETSSLVLGSGSVSIQHTPLLNMTATDFTLEATIFITTYPSNGVYLFDKDGQANASYPQYELVLNSAGKLSGFLGNGNGTSPSGANYLSTNQIPLNTKTHVALVKYGSTCLGFINGILEWTGGVPAMYDGGKPLIIGYQLDQPGNSHFSGKVDGFRVSRTALYTTNFIPPEDNFTPPVDDTAVIINLNGSSFVDASTNAVTFAAIGAASASVVNDHAYLGTKSIRFIGDGALIGSNAAYAFGDKPYSIEADIYLSSVESGGFGSLVDYTSSFDGISFWLTGSGGYRVRIGKSTANAYDDILGTTTLVINKWYRVAIIKRNSNTNGVELRINGAIVATGTSNRSITATDFAIGRVYANSPGEYLTGNISNVTVTTGRGVKTKDYSYTGIDPRIPFILTKFIGSNGDTVFTDDLGGNWVNSGSPVLSNAQEMFNSTSLFLTSDYYISKTLPSAFGTGDFAIECFFYPTSFSGGKTILTQLNGGISISLSASGYIQVAQAYVAVLASSSQNPMSLNQWNSFIFSRVNGIATVKVGGLVALSFTNPTNYSPQDFYIGGYPGQPGGTGYQGYFGPIRIDKGVGSFSVPFADIMPPPPAPVPGSTMILDPDYQSSVATGEAAMFLGTFFNLTPDTRYRLRTMYVTSDNAVVERYSVGPTSSGTGTMDIQNGISITDAMPRGTFKVYLTLSTWTDDVLVIQSDYVIYTLI